MSGALEQRVLIVGTASAARTIAIKARAGNGPGIFWLGGFRSDMEGSKALALDQFGASEGLAVTRFDYSGHGQSGGDFNDGTISRWLEEAKAVLATTSGPQIVVGSSMGGWLALLLAKALLAEGTGRIKALVLIAPATDMTEDLMVGTMSAHERAMLGRQGFVEQPSQYGDGPYRINKSLIDDGARHLLFGKLIETGCPVTILQGGRDPDVPQAHAIKLTTHLLHDPVTLTLIPDGDHRLSRPQDLAMLTGVVGRAARD